jgi:LuxR family maltose regulon positive regulatory protein
VTIGLFVSAGEVGRMPENRIYQGAGEPGVREAGDAAVRPPLLTSKLAVAPLPGAVVTRPRLFHLLDTGAAGPLTLVSAPPGWGKTMLLSSWYRARDADASLAWLSVERGDSGGRLWSYLHAALRSTTDGQEPDALPPPDDPPQPGFLDHLAAGLARRAEPATLIVDDFHRVDDAAVLDGLEYLLRHSGERLRLVIGARSDPALALHRWRLGGELTEIRTAELAFTADEAAELLTTHGITLPTDQVDDLWIRSEGWPAGLRLAALSLQGHPDPPRFVSEFAGDHPGVADYLTEEVLVGLPEDLRRVLTRAAIAERISGELVNALTGRTDGDDLLAELERTGFVVPLGTRPPSYRCHRMLGELLRAELRRRPPAEILDLHRKAAAWHTTHDLPVEALRHALSAQEWGYATGVLVDHWPDLVPYGRGDHAPPPAPPQDVRADPELALAYAAERLDQYDLAAAAGYLHLAARYQQVLAGDRRDRCALISAALELARDRIAGEEEMLRTTAGTLLALAPSTSAAPAQYPAGEPVPGDGPGTAARSTPGITAPSTPGAGARSTPAAGPAARAIAHAVLGAAELAAGDLTAAEAELTQGRADAEKAGVPRAAFACVSRLALVQAVRGHLHAAERAARQALAMPPDRGRPRPADCAHAYLALAIVALQRDRLEDAGTNIALATQPAGEAEEPAVAALVAMVQAQLLRSVGDLAGSHQTLLAGRRQLPDVPRSRELTHWLMAAEADLRTAHGDIVTARKLLLPAWEAGVEPVEPLAVALARTYLVAGEPRAAARILPDWEGPAAERWLLPVRLEAGLLDALISRQVGDGRRAARALERALELAEPERFRRVFTRAEPPARELLSAHLDSGTAHWPTLSELITASDDPGVRPAPVSSPLGEPLTERELTILRYLQSILSNVEIAAELSLSVNTVKTHVRNIYRKLDATRRRDAVRRARELRLL